MAATFGEQNLLICVKSALVSLARSQFPEATVIELPTAARRKFVNLFARNLVSCLPLWLKLRTTPVDGAVCLRSMRNYLETLLFYSARTKRFQRLPDEFWRAYIPIGMLGSPNHWRRPQGHVSTRFTLLGR